MTDHKNEIIKELPSKENDHTLTTHKGEYKLSEGLSTNVAKQFNTGEVVGIDTEGISENDSDGSVRSVRRMSGK